MKISFENKVALVTGAASGLGLATAKAFAEAGASVVLADWNEKEVQAAAKDLANKGHKTLAVHCDVSDDAQVEAMVKQTAVMSRALRTHMDTCRRVLVAVRDASSCTIKPSHGLHVIHADESREHGSELSKAHAPSIWRVSREAG
jgi:FlaA1/EpsC-like NDP-sugar epimerase